MDTELDRVEQPNIFEWDMLKINRQSDQGLRKKMRMPQDSGNRNIKIGMCVSCKF